MQSPLNEIEFGIRQYGGVGDYFILSEEFVGYGFHSRWADPRKAADVVKGLNADAVVPVYSLYDRKGNWLIF